MALHILGIVTRTHDSGLALLSDGIPTLVLEEERFNREKHTMRFPFLSLTAASNGQGLDIDDVDSITTPWDMRCFRRSAFSAVVGRLPGSINLLRPSARPTQATLIVNMPMGLWWGLKWQFGFKRRLPHIIQVRHHDAHAASFFVSPFDEATVLVMDGYGDETAQSAHVGLGNRLERVWQSDFFDSLGMLYSCVTEYLGFRLFEEGTVMALAATGAATYAAKFCELVQLKPDGRFSLNWDFLSFNMYGLNKPFKKNFLTPLDLLANHTNPSPIAIAILPLRFSPLWKRRSCTSSARSPRFIPREIFALAVAWP